MKPLQIHGKNFDRPSRWLCLVAALANGGLWFVLTENLSHTKAFLPIHYTIYFGIDLSGSWPKALWLPGFGLAVLVVHFCIGLVSEGRRWMRGWLITAFFIQLLLLATAVILIAQARISA